MRSLRGSQPLFRESEHTAQHPYVDFYERHLDKLEALIALQVRPSDAPLAADVCALRPVSGRDAVQEIPLQPRQAV